MKITSLFMIAWVALLAWTGLAHRDRGQGSPFEARGHSVVDIDGNTYPTVRIGDQIWMAANLKVTRFRDGSPIPRVQSEQLWPHTTDGAYCTTLDDSGAYTETYGLLYNFHAVADPRQLAPVGWHVPTREECLELIAFLGGSRVAGRKVKDNREDLWKVDNPDANNESGFRGLPAGGRGRFGHVGEVGTYATWWSSTSTEPDFAWHWGVFPDRPGIRSNPGHKASGFSVRCVKDRTP